MFNDDDCGLIWFDLVSAVNWTFQALRHNVSPGARVWFGECLGFPHFKHQEEPLGSNFEHFSLKPATSQCFFPNLRKRSQKNVRWCLPKKKSRFHRASPGEPHRAGGAGGGCGRHQTGQSDGLRRRPRKGLPVETRRKFPGGFGEWTLKKCVKSSQEKWTLSQTKQLKLCKWLALTKQKSLWKVALALVPVEDVPRVITANATTMAFACDNKVEPPRKVHGQLQCGTVEQTEIYGTTWKNTTWQKGQKTHGEGHEISSKQIKFCLFGVQRSKTSECSSEIHTCELNVHWKNPEIRAVRFHGSLEPGYRNRTVRSELLGSNWSKSHGIRPSIVTNFAAKNNGARDGLSASENLKLCR